jgi:biopolymer transport protein ExbD
MLNRRDNRKTENGTHEINMTPLIDVSLVLVVMLLLTTPLAFESGITVRKSQASTNTAEKKDKEKRTELRIISDTEIQVNRTRISRVNLIETLRPLLDEGAHRQVVITCADNVSHGVFVDVLDQAKLCGATDIAVAEK